MKMAIAMALFGGQFSLSFFSLLFIEKKSKRSIEFEEISTFCFLVIQEPPNRSSSNTQNEPLRVQCTSFSLSFLIAQLHNRQRSLRCRSHRLRSSRSFNQRMDFRRRRVGSRGSRRLFRSHGAAVHFYQQGRNRHHSASSLRCARCRQSAYRSLRRHANLR